MSIKKAFTLVELLVVVAIIMLITSSGTMYFFNFLDSVDVKQNIKIIKNNINKLDSSIKNYEIYDYSLEFSAGTKAYIYYINNFDIPYSQTIELDSLSGTGIIKTNAVLNGGIRLLKIYKKNKIYTDLVLLSKDVYTGSFDGSNNYKITGTLSGELLNDIYINYFSQEKSVSLDIISKNSDIRVKNDYCNSKLIITNIGGRKRILCGDTEYKKVYLFFSDNGIGDFIEIK